jgi:hypothetical protein
MVFFLCVIVVRFKFRNWIISGSFFFCLLHFVKLQNQTSATNQICHSSIGNFIYWVLIDIYTKIGVPIWFLSKLFFVKRISM